MATRANLVPESGRAAPTAPQIDLDLCDRRSKTQGKRPHQAASSEARMNNKRFWDEDLRVWARQCLADLVTLVLFVAVFMTLTLPVVVPGLLLWWFQQITGRP